MRRTTYLSFLERSPNERQRFYLTKSKKCDAPSFRRPKLRISCLALQVSPPSTRRYTRKHERVEVHLPIVLVGNSRRPVMEIELTNLGRGGVFISMDNPPHLGESVYLRFQLLRTRLCHASGNVVWRSIEPNYCGFGVCFTRTNLAMDVFTRNLSTLSPKLRAVFLEDVHESTLQIACSSFDHSM